MTEPADIEVGGARQKEILEFARLSWVYCHVEPDQEGDPEICVSPLRFLDTQRLLDGRTTAQEIVLAAPENSVELEAILVQSKFKVSFLLGGELYWFFSSVLSTSVLFGNIKILSLIWPEALHKPFLRKSERVSNDWEGLLGEPVWVKDISTHGIGLVGSEDCLSLDESADVLLWIPAFQRSDEGSLVSAYYKIQLGVNVIRQGSFQQATLWGCKFLESTGKTFFLLRGYISQRAKENAFYREKAYYPTLKLPPIKVALLSRD